jgi:hypothetical protein
MIEKTSLAGWLALREPIDAAGRSPDVTDAVGRSLPRGRIVRAIDLGTGAGSNIRYLESRLDAPIVWRAVDRAPLLTSCLGIEILQAELGSLAPELFQAQDLVTASALLDLVSPSWIGRLARLCRSAGAAVLFALSYDGRSECFPAEPEDDAVRELFNRHQCAIDHGFGRAAGPHAAALALQAFSAAGYEMTSARSDWDLTPDQRDLQRQLIAGWAEAAAEMAPDRLPSIVEWLQRRLAHVDAGQSRILVGHVDLGGWILR